MLVLQTRRSKSWTVRSAWPCWTKATSSSASPAKTRSGCTTRPARWSEKSNRGGRFGETFFWSSAAEACEIILGGIVFLAYNPQRWLQLGGAAVHRFKIRKNRTAMAAAAVVAQRLEWWSSDLEVVSSNATACWASSLLTFSAKLGVFNQVFEKGASLLRKWK